MLIKPINISDSSLIKQGKRLPKGKDLSDYEREESLMFIEYYGRILSMPYIARDRYVRANKNIHRVVSEISNYGCTSSQWELCKCNYALWIRGSDMDMNDEEIKEMRKYL